MIHPVVDEQEVAVTNQPEGRKAPQDQRAGRTGGKSGEMWPDHMRLAVLRNLYDLRNWLTDDPKP